MDLFIYSDESGVFDVIHNDIFIFGGLVFLSKEEKDIWSRKYTVIEKVIRQREGKDIAQEIKAASVSNADKGKLYRSLNKAHKFGVIISQKRVLTSIFMNKKSKQRYLDYAYKIAVKRKFEALICAGIIDPDKVRRLFFFIDEHTTATDGKYELKQSLEQEFRFGTYNVNYSLYYPPIFPSLTNVNVQFCNSAANTLVRAADIVSNKLYHQSRTNTIPESNELMTITRLP